MSECKKEGWWDWTKRNAGKIALGATAAAEMYGWYTGNDTVRPSTYAKKLNDKYQEYADKSSRERLYKEDTDECKKRCNDMHKNNEKDLTHCLLRSCNYRLKEGMGKPEPVTPDNADPQICAKECFQDYPKEDVKKQKEEGNWWNKATTIYYEEKNNPMNPKTWSNALNNCIIRKCDGIDHRRSTEVMADTSTEKGIGALGAVGAGIVDPSGLGRMVYNYATS